MTTSRRQPTGSLLDDVPRSQPALRRAEALGRRAAEVGFDWPDASGVLDKVVEEANELREELGPADDPELAERIQDELGDLLFALANLARKLGTDPEHALHQACAKFERRFAVIETTLAVRGRRPEDATLDELDALWNEAKRAERR